MHIHILLIAYECFACVCVCVCLSYSRPLAKQAGVCLTWRAALENWHNTKIRINKKKMKTSNTNINIEREGERKKKIVTRNTQERRLLARVLVVCVWVILFHLCAVAAGEWFVKSFKRSQSNSIGRCFLESPEDIDRDDSVFVIIYKHIMQHV